MFQVPGRIVVPPYLMVSAGGSYDVDVLKPRDLRIIPPPAYRAGDVRSVVVWPVMLGSGPAEVGLRDAVMAWVNQADWQKVRLENGKILVGGIPPVPCHLFVDFAGDPLYARVHSTLNTLDLRQAERPRSITQAPVVDGLGVAEGCRVFPGRLDILTISEITGPKNGGTDFFTRMPKEGWGATARIACDDSFTVLSAEGEVAYGSWRENGAGIAHSCLGKIEIEFVGVKRTGWVAAWPIWPGGSTTMIPPMGRLHRKFEDASGVVFCGLPLGTYALHWGPPNEVPGSRFQLTRYRRVEMSLREPHARVLLE